MKLLRTLANTWLLIFWADTALGLVDELGALILGLHLLGWVRGVTSALMLLAAPFLWLGVGLSPRLPLSVFLPVLLFCGWVLLGASPVSILLLNTPWLGPAIIGLQALVAAFVAWRVHRLERRAGAGGGGWLLSEASLAGPAVRWGRLAAWVGAHVVLLPPLLAGYAWTSADLALRTTTGGFVSLGLDGVRVAHRDYVRDDRVIDLVGMIHLGDRDAYEALFEPIPVDGTLVLEEGVTDNLGLLPGGPLYGKVADRLGIDEQRPVAQMSALDTRNADVDVSEFSEDTLKFLRKVFAIYAAEDTAAALLDYALYVRAQPDQEALIEGVMEDILDHRNEHLLEEIEEALVDHPRIVVPWGAYHLPDIEQALLDEGFVPRDERRVTLIPFSALGDEP